jgi:hypothetical protein
MAELTTKLVREFFAGSWSCQVFINGELNHEIEFNCTEESGKFSVPRVKLEYWLLTNNGKKEEKSNQIIVAWRSDKHSWVNMWYNESGGYNELQWTSQEKINGNTVLYGYFRERNTEGELPTEHIAMCELLDQENFKYTILSYRKGILEMSAKRTIPAVDEMSVLTEKHANMTNS